MIPWSLLDLAPVPEGATTAEALANTRDLAQHAESWGYHRYWLAEHHNMPGIASAATAIVIGHVAEATREIRVGAGGIMLPNHAPLMVAESFGTLATLYPGRIDLGLGRAPGTDMATARALRRDMAAGDSFPQDVVELMRYLGPQEPGARIRAIPGEGTEVPIWILGSSLFGAQLAAALGLPYAFASHFAPDMLDEALHIYRSRFEPSARLAEPYAAAAVNVFAADTDAEGRRLMTSMEQQFVALRRGMPGRLGPPVDDPDSLGSPGEVRGARHALKESAVGSPATVSSWLQQFVDRTQVDELIVTGQIHDHAARKHSFAIAAEALGLSAAAQASTV